MLRFFGSMPENSLPYMLVLGPKSDKSIPPSIQEEAFCLPTLVSNEVNRFRRLSLRTRELPIVLRMYFSLHAIVAQRTNWLVRAGHVRTCFSSNQYQTAGPATMGRGKSGSFIFCVKRQSDSEHNLPRR